MATFGDLHRDAIAGTIGTFDRLIFKGHLNALFPQGAFKRYLDRRGILLKDAGAFFEAETARLKAHAKALADDSGRPFVYLNAAHTHATDTSKESLARRIAEDDGRAWSARSRPWSRAGRSPWPATGKPNGWRWCAVRANACISTGT